MSAEPRTDIGTLLVTDPDFRDGRPHLRGTRITVHNVAASFIAGATIDEMVAMNPDLDPSLFYAALAYYFANRPQIEADLDDDARRGAALEAEFAGRDRGTSPE